RRLGGVGDQETAVRPDGNVLGPVQLGGGGEPTVTAEAGDPVAGHGGDDAGRRHLADRVRIHVREDEAPAGEQGNRAGQRQLGARRGAVVATRVDRRRGIRARRPVARYRGDETDREEGQDLADAMIALVGDDIYATGRQRRRARDRELGGAGGAAVTARGRRRRARDSSAGPGGDDAEQGPRDLAD